MTTVDLENARPSTNESQNPALSHIETVITGTGAMVSTIMGALAGGDSVEMIHEDYTSIDRTDITAVLKFASVLSQIEDVHYDT